MPEYTVISRRILTGTISDLPTSARVAWIAILFEAEKLRGRVKLPVRDLAKMASITTPEAAESLRLFQEPDPFSSTQDMEGRRLIRLEGEESDWYLVVSWEKHAAERAAFFARLRQQRARSRRVTQGHGALLGITKEPEPEPEPEENLKSKSLAPRIRSSKDLVESFGLEPKHREWITRNTPTVPPDEELAAWRDRLRANGYMAGKNSIRDPQASFYTSCRNAERWGTYTKKGGKTGTVTFKPAPKKLE